MLISEVYNEDCMVGMKRYPNEYFDLCITSTPYNLGNNHHTGNKKHNSYFDNFPEIEYQQKQIDMLNELYRVCKKNCSVFYNHKNRIKDGISISPYLWIFKTEWLVKEELVWFNGSQNFDKCRFYPMTERIYWLSKQKETLFNNNISHHDLFEWTPEGTNKDHTRAFPQKMVSDILSCFPSGLIVFDPYCGSGTTRVVSDKMGFNFVGFEINKKHYDNSLIRFNIYKAQQTLKFE